jgi:arylsulfatase A-like enzyme
VPFLWRPAPSANIAPAEIPEPVGHIDLAPTFCAIAGLPVPEWMQGAPLPQAPGSGREQVLTTWDSQFSKVGMHLATIHRGGVTCTVYSPSTRGVGGRFPILWPLWNRGGEIPRYDGTEGELYDLREDPLERVNLWSDPARRALRDELAAALRAGLPPPRVAPLPVSAPT